MHSSTELVVHGGQLQKSLINIFEQYDELKENIIRFSNTFKELQFDGIQYFTTGKQSWHSASISDYFSDYEYAMKSLDCDFWQRVFRMTDLSEVMPADDRNKWREDISNRVVPPFERETVYNTITGLLEMRGNFFAKKVEGIFNKLSPTHVTNSPMAFKGKLIINNLITKNSGGGHTWYSYNSNKTEYLDDLRSVIGKILDAPYHNSSSSDIHTLIQEGRYSEWVYFDNFNFKIKIHKAGTAHIEISEEIADKLNLALHSLYPNVIATKDNRKKTKEKQTKIYSYQNNILSNDQLSILSRVKDYIGFNEAYGGWYIRFKHTLENDKIRNVVDMLGIQSHNTTEVDVTNSRYDSKFYSRFNNQQLDLTKTLNVILRLGAIPDFKSHQYYPTPNEIVEVMQYILKWKEGMSVLEPSAGIGNLISSEMKPYTHCFEVSTIFQEILRANGYKVEGGDFLEAKNVRFDRIIMNPPYSENRWKLHIMKAYELLDKDGILIALIPGASIVPLEEAFKRNGIRAGIDFVAKFEDSFDNTKITTSVIRIEK